MSVDKSSAKPEFTILRESLQIVKKLVDKTDLSEQIPGMQEKDSGFRILILAAG